MIRKWLRGQRIKLRVNKAKKNGLVIADDCRITNPPNFGTEPYLICIEPKCIISGDVTFLTHDGSTGLFRDLPEYKGTRKFGRVTVREGSFIGHGAIIMPGVTIGPNSIVAAGAVVMGDVPPNTVSWGNPARPLMSTESYIEKVVANNPAWDEEAYKRDKRGEILRHFPLKGPL